MILAAMLGLGLCAARPPVAQPYPAHPITIVVPFAPGGATDVLPRMLGERLREALGQSVIIENVSGAGGTIGLGRVARAAPDGYTLVSGNWSTFVGPGPHSAGVRLQSLTGTTFPLIHYRGGGPALQDLLSGQVDLMTNQAVVFLPHARAGTIKVFAVLAKDRLVQAPEIPTADEAGLAGFHVSVWNGVLAPEGTPQEVISRRNAAVVSILAEPEVRQRLIDLAYEIPSPEQQTPQALGALQRAEIEKWWPIIKAAGVKAD